MCIWGELMIHCYDSELMYTVIGSWSYKKYLTAFTLNPLKTSNNTLIFSYHFVYESTAEVNFICSYECLAVLQASSQIADCIWNWTGQWYFLIQLCKAVRNKINAEGSKRFIIAIVSWKLTPVHVCVWKWRLIIVLLSLHCSTLPWKERELKNLHTLTMTWLVE